MGGGLGSVTDFHEATGSYTPRHLNAEVGVAWEEVWSARQLDGAREAFVTCGGDDDDEEEERDDERDAAAAPGQRGVPSRVDALADALRASFERSRAWRAGAADRRAAEDAAWLDALRRRVPLVGGGRFGGAAALADAVECFGLASLDEAALFTPRGLRTRWRALALRRHPDTGGTAEEFRALERHYQALLAACGGSEQHRG